MSLRLLLHINFIILIKVVRHSKIKFNPYHELNVTVKLGGSAYSFNWKLLDPEKDRLNKLTDDMYK